MKLVFSAIRNRLILSWHFVPFSLTEYSILEVGTESSQVSRLKLVFRMDSAYLYSFEHSNGVWSLSPHFIIFIYSFTD